jgi:hypothetical protein
LYLDWVRSYSTAVSERLDEGTGPLRSPKVRARLVDAPLAGFADFAAVTGAEMPAGSDEPGWRGCNDAAWWQRRSGLQ